jgi:hypothetical protein
LAGWCATLTTGGSLSLGKVNTTFTLNKISYSFTGLALYPGTFVVGKITGGDGSRRWRLSSTSPESGGYAPNISA